MQTVVPDWLVLLVGTGCVRSWAGCLRILIIFNQAEEVSHVLEHRFGLIIELLSGAGSFFRTGGIALGNAVHLGQRSADLDDTFCLLP